MVKKLVLVLCLILINFGGVLAQEDYRLGIDDVIHISVWQEKDLDKTLTIASDGYINFPLIGRVKACGLTVMELTAEITARLQQDFLVHPQVNIEVKNYNSKRVYVLGNVDRPGVYSLKGKADILDILSMVGGVTTKAGNELLVIRASAAEIKQGKEIVELLHQKEVVKSDLHELLTKGNLKHNLILGAGDVVYVPSRESIIDQNIYVMGAVAKAGSYEFKSGLTALNACIIAGGFTPVAAPNRTQITRYDNGKQKIIKIDLNEVNKGNIADIKLAPADRIFIPESYF